MITYFFLTLTLLLVGIKLVVLLKQRRSAPSDAMIDQYLLTLVNDESDDDEKKDWRPVSKK